MIGPITISKLQDLARTGRLRPDDQVRQTLDEAWKSASEVLTFPHQTASSVVEPPPISSTESQPVSVKEQAEPFLGWYRDRWVYSLRWFYQLPIWLVYGFVWIPIWYVLSATPSGGPKARWVSLSLSGRAVACLPMLLMPQLLSRSPSGTSYDPNGQEILYSENGDFHYYLDETGEKVMHGRCNTKIIGGDGNTKQSESEYDAGTLVRRTTRSSDGSIVEILERQNDGNYVWDNVEVVSPDMKVHHRSIARYTSEGGATRVEAIKELGTVLFLHDREVDQSSQYVEGFLNGVRRTMTHKRAADEAKSRGDGSYETVISLFQRDAPKTISTYRNLANQQMSHGINADEMNGIVDGLTHGFASFGINPN